MDTQDDKTPKINPFRMLRQKQQSITNEPNIQSQNTPPTLAQLETEIKFHLSRASQSIIEVGKRLTQAKSLVQHGEWRNWLENNFTLNERTAQRFMQISERFVNKSVDIDGFKPSQLTEMLALPDATETEKFIEQKAAEGTPVPDMSIKTLRKEIKKWKNKSTDNTKQKSSEEQNIAETENQKHTPLNEDKSDDAEVFEQESRVEEQSSTEAQGQNKQTIFPTAKDILGITDDDEKAFSLAIKTNATTESVNVSPLKVLDNLFRAINELVVIPDLKQKIYDYASVDPEWFYSDVDNLFRVVNIIKEIDNRK